MALDPHYIPAEGLEMYFVDKDTGLPLSGGVVHFFQDINRINPKPVFKISGTPPNYTYTNIGSTLTLSGVGTMTDGNPGTNDIQYYYFPYDANGNVDLYYIQVYSSTGIFQWDREGHPNLVAEAPVNNEEIINYIANGQFKLHYNVLSPSSNPTSNITQTNTAVAPGGWFYIRSAVGAVVDNVSFSRFTSYTTNPTASPRYGIQLNLPSEVSATKWLAYTFNDVNKFALDAEMFTFAVTGASQTGSSQSLTLAYQKIYGTGGSPASGPVTVGTLTFGTAYTLQQISFTIPDNFSKTIGPNDDDVFQLLLISPNSQSTNIILSDFIFTPGAVTLTGFPQTPDNVFNYQSILSNLFGFQSNNIQNYANNAFLGLPVILGKNGFQFDTTNVGKVYASILGAQFGELLCDGTTYDPTTYSSDGIPYGRLWSNIYNTMINFPIYGTGKNYLSNYLLNVNTQFLLSTNQSGSTTNIADGSSPTGFTFQTLTAGQATLNFTAYRQSLTQVLVYGNIAGAIINDPSLLKQTGVIDGLSATGFTFAQIRFGNPEIFPLTLSAPYQLFTILVTRVPTAGNYFTCYNTTTAYCFWFQVNGSGSAPALGPSYTYIQVSILSTFSTTDVANILMNTFNGTQLSLVTPVAGSSITAGSYFSVYSASPATQYVVWYTVNGSGTQPVVSNAVYVNVPVLSSDAATAIVTKTQIAMNSRFFQVPDFRGKFLRMKDYGSGWDVESTFRFSQIPLFGDNIGTLEYDQVVSHQHSPFAQALNFVCSDNTIHAAFSFNSGSAASYQPVTAYTGGSENRVINANIDYVIKY